MYYVYILRSQKDKSLYIGYTSDLKKRFSSHNKGLNKATKYKLPYTLLFYEAFQNRTDAKNREEYLKGGFGLRSIKKMMRHTLENSSSSAA